IGAYAFAILKGRGRALLLSGVLAVLYGYLYVLLQAEDLALLLGAIGLFLILGVVMYVTRRIDWYGSGRAGGGGEGGVGQRAEKAHPLSVYIGRFRLDRGRTAQWRGCRCLAGS